jgi:hypothetical protein
MDDLLIEPTNNTPMVNFFSGGKLIMAGSLFAENAPEFFSPLMSWIDNLKVNEADFDLIIEYLNTACAKQLLRLLLKLKNSSNVQHVKVNWFYEMEDEESLETGKILAESIPDIDFNFTIYERKANN